MYTLRVLGGFALVGPTGEPVCGLSQPRVEALLAVLAVSGDLGCRRDRMLGFLWPDIDESRGRHSLSVALHAVRQVLGVEAIVARGEILVLNPAVITSDIQEFTRALAATPLADALQSYRGPLLDGFHVDGAPEFERWIDSARARLYREFGEAVERLATQAESAGAWAEAANWWTRAVGHDPHNTRLVVRLMRALAAAGDRANALREAEAHRLRLLKELELPPEPELLAEIARIRDGNGGAAVRAGPPSPAHPAAPVAPVLGAAMAGGAAAPTQPVKPRQPAVPTPPALAGWTARRRFGVIVSAGVLTVAIAGALSVLVRPPAPIVVTGERVPISREPEIEFFATISPDGHSVAYVARTDSGWTVFDRDATGGRALALGRGFGPLAWTADGSFVALGPTLLPRMGGPPQRTSAGALRSARPGRAVFQRGDSLVLAAMDGTGETLAVVAPEITSAVLSPDGRRLAWAQGNTQFAEYAVLGNVAPSAIWVADVPGGHAVQVAGPGSLNISPAWLRDGRHLLFISDRNGPRDLYVATLDRGGRPRGEPVRLTTGLEAGGVSVSDDGSRAAYTHFVVSRNIYTLPIPRAGSVSTSAARPLTRGTQLIEMHALSPDGRWLAYQTDRSGNQDIWIMPAEGGEPRQLTHNPHEDMGPDFSPDGSEIAFYSTRFGSRDLFTIHVDGTGETRITDGPGEELLADYSPDGLRLLFDAGPTMHERGIATAARERLGAPWGAPTTVVAGGALGARWAPDGRRFAFWRFPGPNPLATRSLEGDVRLLTDTPTFPLCCVARIAWSPRGDALYFTAAPVSPGRWAVFRIRASGGLPELLVRDDDAARRIFADGLTVGNGLLYLTLGEFTSDIYMMRLGLPR